MEKTKIGPHGFLYPMPMVIVGADVGGKANFIAVGWVTRTNYAPPRIGPSNEFFIGEIVQTYCNPDCLADGKPDIRRIKPFTLTMPDNRYWAVGAQVGKAWSDGRAFGKG